MQFPLLTTERLILRSLTLEDAPEILRIRSDDRVNKYLDRPKATSIEDALAFIRKIQAANEGFYWAITLKDNNTLIGSVCFWNIMIDKKSGEIGYELHPDYQGKGIMQEAITAAIKYGFESAGFNVITALSSADNENSIRLLERNNFVKDTNFEYISKEELDNQVGYILKKIPGS
ncbi:ribosomal-protein-alanine N-acetyltransferase [Chitinophaga sp. YR573]|uniref:GNAT family N-acetyltransferase n=1 Tax=Chitinophaga sp. YR573 TaxID=1881040 RepID=UPI0008AF732C|nr:GNAT family N-acetyltransferase [Chitinophaga sp. YR573]SEW37689.1 ribosomal-protein-alanine N-acetyltransferase [Chitinophaga sp. YR573]